MLFSPSKISIFYKNLYYLYQATKMIQKFTASFLTPTRKPPIGPWGYLGNIKASFLPSRILYPTAERMRDYNKRLFSTKLPLPENWNYTTRSIAKICKAGPDNIEPALKKLEQARYIVHNQLRDSKSKIVNV